MMKVIFFGTPDFAAAVLGALADSRHEVLAVVCQPDRPAGRGKKMVAPPVKILADNLGIVCLQPERVRAGGFLGEIAGFGADVFVTAAYGQLFSQKLLDIPKYGCVNVHASLLPKYRGASPIQQAILAGDDVTGVTIMQMDRGMDTGDILLMCEIAISGEDTGGSLHDKFCQISPGALLDTLEMIDTNKLAPIPQDNDFASHAPILTKEMGRIIWTSPVAAILRQIRAYDPWPGCYTEIFGENVKIWKATQSGFCGAAIGEIICANPKDGLHIKCGDGAIQILEIQPQNGKRMNAADFLRGRMSG
ncbi:MAG: methionyl-tRNA formyltransferase [Defluviitaleaceae bacterium]|nr:methionyl-tRNA formyltransferase [Defluviitaleaceae bacterium]